MLKYTPTLKDHLEEGYQKLLPSVTIFVLPGHRVMSRYLQILCGGNFFTHVSECPQVVLSPTKRESPAKQSHKQ